MKPKSSLALVLAVLVIALMIGVGSAQESDDNLAPPEMLRQTPLERVPNVEPVDSSLVASAFSYQGVLKEDGEPVTGNREMTFRFYNSESCLKLVGGPVVSTVPVNEGVFSVNLAVDQSLFDGTAIWLETEVGGIALGCQEVQAVPYALSLRPGAIVDGAVTNGAGITVINSDNSFGGGKAIVGYASNGTAEDIHPGTAFYNAAGEFSGSNGVIGASSSDYDDGYGVIGIAQGSFGRGVYGYSSATEGNTVGVFGETESDDGIGVMGVAESYSGTTYGVYGLDYSEYGYGVFGAAAAITGTTVGVYGRTSSPYGYGGYFVNAVDNDAPDLVVGTGGGYDDGIISSDPQDPGSDLLLQSNDDVRIKLDQDNDESGYFSVENGNEETVFSVTEEGDVIQLPSGDGLVKAAASVYCSDVNSYIMRSFNNVGGAIMASTGDSSGNCSIDFGFTIVDRYWMATAVFNSPRLVTCAIGNATDTLDCYRARPDGAGISGEIIITIY